MQLIYKKSIMQLFSLLSLVRLFGINTTNTKASAKLNPQEQEIYNAMTKDKQKEYFKIKKIKPKNPLAKEQKKKFDKLKNNKYIIIDSKELKGEDKVIGITISSQTRGYGSNFIQVFWWGFRSDTNWRWQYNEF